MNVMLCCNIVKHDWLGGGSVCGGFLDGEGIDITERQSNLDKPKLVTPPWVLMSFVSQDLKIERCVY